MGPGGPVVLGGGTRCRWMPACVPAGTRGCLAMAARGPPAPAYSRRALRAQSQEGRYCFEAAAGPRLFWSGPPGPIPGGTVLL